MFLHKYISFDWPRFAHITGWKPALLVAMALLMASCHSHRNVVNANNGNVLVDKKDNKKDKLQEIPKLTGTANNKHTKALLEEAYSWIGTPYVYGGQDRSGADCSGFVMVVYLKALEIKLPRVSREQGEFCRKIKKSDLVPGDLVFFCTGSSKRVNHVGIYVGDGKMIHASSHGVMVSDITQKYYIDHYDHSGCVEAYRKLIGK